jgi:hypothetical protein
VLLSRERVAVLAIHRTGVAEDAAEGIGEEVGQQLMLFERVRLAVEVLRPVRSADGSTAFVATRTLIRSASSSALGPSLAAPSLPVADRPALSWSRTSVSSDK